MIRIVAEASVPYLRGVLEDMGEVTYLPSSEFTPETIAGADWLIIRSITRCTRELLQGSSVRLITTATIGYDHIDTEYCAEASITWYNSPGCNAEAVGQYFASCMATLVAEKGLDPRRATLGIVGVGHVGKVVQRYARAFGMTTLLCDPPRAEAEGHGSFVTLAEIAEQCDVITLHTPLTKVGKYATWHMIDDLFVTSLKRSKPILINACRGGVTDTDALLKGLHTGKIGEVIIDCWENEPHISKALLDRAFIATPHIAGFSADGKANGARMCVENGVRYFGIAAPKMSEIMQPPAPVPDVIDLEQLPEPRLYHALLRSFAPRRVDALLRERWQEFEQLRKSYDYPREPFAYKYIGDDGAVAALLP